jgi:hypothetical protein
MRYGISKDYLGFEGFFEIGETVYLQIANARKNLLEALYLEEKFDLVTENYYEFETELLSLATRSMIFRRHDYFSITVDRNLVNRRIMNLLTTCTTYKDQSAHIISKIYGQNSDNFKNIEKVKSLIYDQSLGYRVMEALRNYVQHRGFPISSFFYSYGYIGNDPKIEINHRVIPYLSISSIEDDGKFNKKTLQELKAIRSKDKVDVRPLIRDYVEGIGKIHEKCRELMQNDIKKWEKYFDSVRNLVQRMRRYNHSYARKNIQKDHEYRT